LFAASFWTTLVTISSSVVVIVVFLSIIRPRKTPHLSFLRIR
jgi:hypothetical protein